MKKLFTLFTVILLSISSFNIQAQAFDKGTKLITIALGPGAMIHFPASGYGGYYGSGYNYVDITGELTVQGEFGVHKYVGVGFVAGIGGKAVNHEFNIPIGLLANFHFFQLIADKKGLELGNKLDVYAGVTLGSGVAIHHYNDQFYGKFTYTDALFYLGPHAGVNYYFAKNIAVNGEIGWGATFIQGGITFKLGGGKLGGKGK